MFIWEVGSESKLLFIRKSVIITALRHDFILTP